MNKKIIAIILSVLMLLSALPVFSFAGTPGDVDASGKIDATDARITLRAAVSLEKLTDEQMKLADVDFNGTVNATDARLILRAAVGLEELHKHSFSSAVTKAAGCTEKGETTFACECGESYTEEIPATGHTAVKDEAVEPSCTEDGKTEGEHCSVCNEVLKAQETVPAKGHTAVKDEAAQPTCTEDGLTEGEHCSVCNEVLKEQETAAALGHTAVKDEAVAPTCTEDGLTEGEHCSVCNEVLKAQETVAALGHKAVTDVAVAPTCTVDGKTEGEHCSVCNEVLKAQETIPATGHEPVTDKAAEPTCTEDGKTEGVHCFICGEVLKAQETVPATGHELVITEEAVSPTCTEEGKTQGGYCKTCDSEVLSEEVPALGHDFKNISLTSATKCSVPGCEGEMPAFNTMVNVLKSRSGILNYFTGIFEDISHYDEPVVSGMLADMMEGEDMAASTEVSYAPLTVDRLITNTNFHSKGMGYVSDLTDADVKSISVQKVSTVDFVDALPSGFSSGKFNYDISAIKAYEFPELYKITIVIPESTVDLTKPVEGTFVHDKIYTKNYRNLLEDMRLDVASGFDSLAKEMAGLESFVKMSNSGKIKTALTVEYFVKTDTFTPVAAKYSHVIDVDFTIKLTGAGLIKIEYLKMNQKMDMTSNAYYFFNNDFGMQ